MLQPLQDDQDWRQIIATQMGKLADAQAQTAVTLERINGRLDTLDEWRREQRQAVAAATPTPASRAALSQAWAGWAAMAVAVLALLLAAGAHITFH